MAQLDYIKEIAKYSLENDREKLVNAFNELIEYAKKTNKINFALQLQAIIRDTLRNEESHTRIHSKSRKVSIPFEENEYNDLILEKLVSQYTFNNIILENSVKKNLQNLVNEHKQYEKLKQFDLPISNKILFYGPSGCGKTLASYVLAGELAKTLLVINLGAIVSSKLGETSKNLAKVFKRASIENSIIFIDEFDSLGKMREISQDHGEMKRVVNTILQLFDYLPEQNLLIAATNRINLIDNALLRRFDIKLELSLPDKNQIKELINLILNSEKFIPDNRKNITRIVNNALGLSYYSIQKSLIDAIKVALLKNIDKNIKKVIFKSDIWLKNIIKEKNNSGNK